MSVVLASEARRAVSPYARGLAAARAIALDLLQGSGPNGRIVAADVLAYVPRTEERPTIGSTINVSAIGTAIELGVLLPLLDRFADADTPFALDDIVLRAVGCALNDVVSDTAPIAGAVALEVGRRQLVFDDIGRQSLGPLRARRIAALESSADDANQPAGLSIRLIAAAGIRPVLLPLLPHRAMRLALVVGEACAEALLVFDSQVVEEDKATAILVRFKGYLEVPLRLLA